MIPSLRPDIVLQDQPTAPARTYRLDIERGRILGMTDGLDALRQAIYKTLSTERYAHVIYSWDYGTELVELIGTPTTWAVPELERRITEALSQDDRITGVSDFTHQIDRDKITVRFVVSSIYGTTQETLEVPT